MPQVVGTLCPACFGNRPPISSEERAVVGPRPATPEPAADGEPRSKTAAAFWDRWDLVDRLVGTEILLVSLSCTVGVLTVARDGPSALNVNVWADRGLGAWLAVGAYWLGLGVWFGGVSRKWSVWHTGLASLLVVACGLALLHLGAAALG